MGDPERSWKRRVLYINAIIHHVVHAVIHAADHVRPFSPVKPLLHPFKQSLIVGANPVSARILTAFKSFQIQRCRGLYIRLENELHGSRPVIVSPADAAVRVRLLRQSGHIPEGTRHISLNAVHQPIKGILLQKNGNGGSQNRSPEKSSSCRTALYRKPGPSDAGKGMASSSFSGMADHLKGDLKQQKQRITGQAGDAYTGRRCRVLLPDRKHREHEQRKCGKKQADSMFLHHTFQQKKNDGQNSGSQNRRLRDICRFPARLQREPVQQPAKLQPKRIPEQISIQNTSRKHDGKQQIKQSSLSVPAQPQSPAEKTGKGIDCQRMYAHSIQRMQKQKQPEYARHEKNKLSRGAPVLSLFLLFSGSDFDTVHICLPHSRIFSPIHLRRFPRPPGQPATERIPFLPFPAPVSASKTDGSAFHSNTAPDPDSGRSLLP